MKCVIVLLSLGFGACGSETPRRSVRLTMSTEVGVPTDVDRVELTFTASRTSLGATCLPVHDGWDLAGPADLPIVVDFVPGEVYGSWIGLRVAWLKSGTPVDVREVMVPWPEAGIYPVNIRLERRCLTAGCPADGQCIEGRCVALPEPGPLDDSLIEPAAPSCDRDAGPSDGGSDEAGEAGDDDSGDDTLVGGDDGANEGLADGAG